MLSEEPQSKKKPIPGQLADAWEYGFVRATEGFLDTRRKKELWERFSAAHHGEFEIKTTVDAAFTFFRMTIPLDAAEIVFVETDTHPLKVSAVISPGDPFRFSIWPQDFVDAVMHVFGAQDVLIGDEEFDRAFVVKATDERRVKRLLESAEIKSFLLAKAGSSLRTEESDGKAHLRMTVDRTTETKDELESLLSFFCAVLRRMRESGTVP